MNSTTSTVGAPARACGHHNARLRSFRIIHLSSLDTHRSGSSCGGSDVATVYSSQADGESSCDLSWGGPELDLPEPMTTTPIRGVCYDPRIHSLKAAQEMRDSHMSCSGTSAKSVLSSVKNNLKNLLWKFAYKGHETKPEAMNEPTETSSQHQISQQGRRSVERLSSKPTGRTTTASVLLSPTAAEPIASRKALARRVASMRHVCPHDSDTWSITAVMSE